MKLTVSESKFLSVISSKNPSKSVIVPIVDDLKKTFAKAIGSRVVASVTFPLIIVCCEIEKFE